MPPRMGAARRAAAPERALMKSAAAAGQAAARREFDDAIARRAAGRTTSPRRLFFCDRLVPGFLQLDAHMLMIVFVSLLPRRGRQGIRPRPTGRRIKRAAMTSLPPLAGLATMYRSRARIFSYRAMRRRHHRTYRLFLASKMLRPRKGCSTRRPGRNAQKFLTHTSTQAWRRRAYFAAPEMRHAGIHAMNTAPGYSRRYSRQGAAISRRTSQ